MMQARMKNPVMIFPEALQAMLALAKSTGKGDVPTRTLDLVYLRASQINGCSFCVEMHARDLRKAGESDERLFAVAAWRGGGVGGGGGGGGDLFSHDPSGGGWAPPGAPPPPKRPTRPGMGGDRGRGRQALR